MKTAFFGVFVARRQAGDAESTDGRRLGVGTSLAVCERACTGFRHALREALVELVSSAGSLSRRRAALASKKWIASLDGPNGVRACDGRVFEPQGALLRRVNQSG